MVGMFGQVIFSASGFLAKSMKRNTSSEWSEHKIMNQMPINQKTGLELGTFSCDLSFNSRHTMKFEQAMQILEGYVISGEYFPLIIGNQLVGGMQYPNYIIKKVSGDYNITDNKGQSLASSANVDFQQYRPVITPSTGGLNSNPGGLMGGVGSALSSALGGISGLSGAVSGLGGISSIGGALGSLSSIGGVLSSIPGVGSAISGISGTIGQLVGATGVAGVIGQINTVMSAAGTIVNGIRSGNITGAMAGLASLGGINMANSISLANGGGVTADAAGFDPDPDSNYLAEGDTGSVSVPTPATPSTPAKEPVDTDETGDGTSDPDPNDQED